MTKKEKEQLIVTSYKDGTLTRIGKGFSVPASFFVLGITPRMVDKILKGR